MKLKPVIFICSVIGILFFSNIIYTQPFTNSSSNYSLSDFNEITQMSEVSNKRLIDNVFNSKVADYYDAGYFPQIYEPSLQATYYALYTLSRVGKLHEINQSKIINYIMDHYEDDSTHFMDTLAYRYLDTDFTKSYFPLSTVLEVTCYAILSLELLDALYLIDVSEIIDFIWSCFNPSTGGFIGRQYNADLEDGYKIATADNTYFAVITLDLLMDDWFGYSSQRASIISFINALQLTEGMGWTVGGFENDEDESFDSLLFHYEPNLISSYYCIKTLEVFGMVSSINEVDFYQFLSYLYDPDSHYFRISALDYGLNYTNIVATSIGLELSVITGFIGINTTETVSFILNHRNSLGNWDQSTTVAIHELIDTYQIIRSLYNTNEIFQLSKGDRSLIGNATLYYQSYIAFSLLSEDYNSMNLIHTVVSSFDLYTRISDLNIQKLYGAIKNSYRDYPPDDISRYFNGYLRQDTMIEWFRSYPIEFYTSGHKIYINKIDQINSHQSTYYALESLEKLFKLDDFANSFDLMDLMNDIVKTQFLNTTYYDTFGGFTSILKYTKDRSEVINNKIYCDYTYYAIKCLELLGNYLGLNFAEIGFDITAIYNYIDRNLIETSTMLYFSPKYADDVATILKTTYFMTYVLKVLNLFNKNSQKIKNYVETNLNYSNIKNIYYSYKLSELLNLNIEFNFHKIQALVQDIFSDNSNEFYFTTDKEILNQEIFFWICEMARTSDIGIDARHSDTCQLGGLNHMEVSLYNLILRDFGTYITFKFESEQIGSFVFSKLSNNSYVYNIPIPINSDCYPLIEGYLRAYEGMQVKAELYISFSTNYTLECEINYHSDLNGLLFKINVSILANYEKFPLTSGRSYAQIYRNNEYLDEIHAIHEDFSDYSMFSIIYNPSMTGEYKFELFINDGIYGSPINVKSVFFDVNQISESYKKDIARAIPLTIIFIAVPGIVFIISSKQLEKLKKESKNN
ncbi:MAG: hypothetical protein ACFFA4_02345 [Promethearchaeota archaeon]